VIPVISHDGEKTLRPTAIWNGTSRIIAGVEVFRLIVGLVMLGIVISLGSALFHLMTDKGDSKKMVRALTVRVALSVALFIALMAAWAVGLIQPLGAGR
jgi:cytochrome bd-type quinol oxidase subunit 2